MSEFTVSAGAGTDIWKKPPTTNVFNGQSHQHLLIIVADNSLGSGFRVILPRKLTPVLAPYKTNSSAPLSTFKSASITFTASYTTQYDQAGLLLIFHPPGSSSTSSSSSVPPKWIKTGIEFYNGSPRLSTVCCDNYADWSVAPLPSPSAENRPVAEGRQPVTVRIAKEGDENGIGFWVYYVPQGAGEEKREFVPLREIAWIYGLDKPEEWKLEVAAAVARPNKEVKGELEAKFWDFKVEWE